MCCVEKLSVCLEVNHKQLEVGFKPRVNSSGRGEGQRARLSVTLSAFLNLRISGFPGGSTGKESACNAGDLGSIPGLGRAPGEGKGYPFQSSGLENSRVPKAWTRLSDFHLNSKREGKSSV